MTEKVDPIDDADEEADADPVETALLSQLEPQDSFTGNWGWRAIVALAVAPRVKMPIHDHDTWGVTGLYQGSQVSHVFRKEESRGRLKLSQTRKQQMKSGDVSVILPPGEDLRMVEAKSKIPAVSISVLGADIGCERRRTFEKRSGHSGEFTLEYSNASCR